MNIKIYQFLFLFLFSFCFLFACQTDVKSTPAPASVTPAPKPKSGTVATPPDRVEPDKMDNNFLRLQGEWQQVDVPEKQIQFRDKKVVELAAGKKRTERSKKFRVVKQCNGEMDMNGLFYMLDNRCYKILKISIEEMEVEDLEQQRVIKYRRI